MLLMSTCDRTGAMHVIARAKLRQGSMPHVPLAVSEVLRKALRDTRNASRVIPHSEWIQRLGSLYKEDCSSGLQLVASDSEQSQDASLVTSVDDGGCDEDEDDDADGNTFGRHVLCCDAAVNTSDTQCIASDTHCVAASDTQCIASDTHCTANNTHCAASDTHCIAASDTQCIAASDTQCIAASDTHCIAASDTHCIAASDTHCIAAASDTHCIASDTHDSCIEASSALRVTSPVKEYARIVSQLSAFGVPETKSRTNIGNCRSQLFGLFTRRGLGVTKVTSSRTQVLNLVHELAKTRADPTPYLSVAFNELHDSSVQEHVDANNEGCSDLTVFGDFEGGRFCQLGEELDVKGKWVRFFAQLPHSVSSSRGRRLSISLFTPRLTHKVEDSLWSTLLEAGFPVREYFMRKIPQVVTSVSQSNPNVLAAASEASFRPRKRDQEDYCCTCGRLTPYECWHPDGCGCHVCTECCRLHSDPEGGTTIACVHHGNQLPERLSKRSGSRAVSMFCAPFSTKDNKCANTSNACSCREMRESNSDTRTLKEKGEEEETCKGLSAQGCFAERSSVASQVDVLALLADADVSLEEEERALFGDEWQAEDSAEPVESWPGERDYVARAEEEEEADLEEELDALQIDFQREHDDMEASRLGSLIPERDAYMEHVRSGHCPKAAWCPACQLSEGPVFAHR
eukprot:6492153-Amphidinium_carterae.1